jgi:hypothetical protein
MATGGIAADTTSQGFGARREAAGAAFVGIAHCLIHRHARTRGEVRQLQDLYSDAAAARSRPVTIASQYQIGGDTAAPHAYISVDAPR